MGELLTNTGGKRVLIVPLWNWNLVKDFPSKAYHSSFNRTFMELKYAGDAAQVMLSASFNRTFMELKYIKFLLQFQQLLTF